MVHCVFIYRILTQNFISTHIDGSLCLFSRIPTQKFISTHIDGVRCVVISKILTQIFISTHINGTFCLYIKNTNQEFISTIIDDTLCFIYRISPINLSAPLLIIHRNLSLPLLMIRHVFIPRVPTPKIAITLIDDTLCLYFQSTDSEIYQCMVCVILEY